jgi:hypothetical protein
MDFETLINIRSLEESDDEEHEPLFQYQSTSCCTQN